MITCKECEAKGNPNTFKAITSRHLRFHHDGMTIDEYKEKWPDAPLRDNRLTVDVPEVTDEHCRELIGTLRPIEQQYIAARLKHPTKDTAARAIGMSPSSIYNWKNRPLVEALIGYLQIEPIVKGMTMIAQAVPDTVQNILDLRHSQDDRVALSASKDILDRAGATTQKTTIDIAVYQKMPTDQLDREIEQMLERQLALEAQYEEIHE